MSSGSKKRPIVIISDDGNYVTCFKLTTTFNSKYFKLISWHKVFGLHSQSYIDTNLIIKLNKKYLETFAGHLAIEDIRKFIKFIGNKDNKDRSSMLQDNLLKIRR